MALNPTVHGARSHVQYWLRILTPPCVGAAFLFCIARALHLWHVTPSCDAGQYVQGAIDIRVNGILEPFTGNALRSYGYPAFLALVGGSSLGDGPSRITVTVIQFCFYLAAVLSLKFGLRQASLHREAQSILLLSCVNLPILVLMPEFLTDSLSLSLCLIATSLMLCLPAVTESSRPGLLWGLGLCLGITTGFAVSVRPGNVWLGACVALVSLVHSWYRGAKQAQTCTLMILLLAIGAAVPLSVQVRNNYTHYNKITPLVTYDLANLQFEGGKRLIKYTTKVSDGRFYAGEYVNPMYKKSEDIDTARWYSWYINHPIAGISTLLLKVFNVLDVDLLFPYAESQNPWYRWPISIFNQLVLCIGAAGVIWCSRPEASPRVRHAALVAIISFFCFMGVHSISAVESRYGLPMLATIVAFVPSGIVFLRHELDISRLRWVFCLGIYLTSSLVLSDWVHQQLS